MSITLKRIEIFSAKLTQMFGLTLRTHKKMVGLTKREIAIEFNTVFD